ncbi:siderophore ferric iron reductase [Shewanella intestini]|uniref:Siderophore ferric iron reductase n=1 Tax=Shewanella intestini TaxID=2017544 RepID=A0ABS5I454_9GAMM|nr:MULTISPECIES: siderophore ferric iron reductase [Shewanella]MBR9728802.1 siderophore ferric iron reductase [Shewanella intestini]MRG36877.1 siderophore ferric iron reductase [Shewanella sp. XMDDZSB0408]
MNQAVFRGLYQQCQQVSPYLKGEWQIMDEQDPSTISLARSNLSSIRALYQSLQQQSPEAGAAYWLTRSWNLLTWQPLYIAITAIYHCKVLPDLCSLSQTHKNGLIAGFSFSCTRCDTGENAQLVNRAGEQLRRIFEHLRTDLDRSFRCRPRFVEHLIADALLSRLLLLQHSHPEMSVCFIRNQATLWLNALNLPQAHVNKIQYSESTKQLIFNRSSCCCIYKTAAGNKCANCPRK